MRAVDTNALVRLIARDDPIQTQAAERFTAGGVWISTLALAEAAWVLNSNFQLSAAEIASAFAMLIENPDVVLQDADAVEDALLLFRAKPSLGFTDCMLVSLARRNGYILGTFDRKLSKVDGAQKI